MKKGLVRILILIAGSFAFPSPAALGGNPDRAGQAGASELLINPWARSSGWAGANSGSVTGLEASFLNVAGTAFVKKTEVGYTNTQLMKGSDISINTFGISQKLGESSVISAIISSINFGDIMVTTTDLPEGGLGTFSPQYMNITLSFAKSFSSSIYGGFSIKMVDEKISNLGARGVALDAGIQYVTGNNADRDNFKFGVALKNVGTTMDFAGDGLDFKTTTSSGYEMTVSQRTNGFEMPSLLNIGLSYDAQLAANHRMTVAAAFTSNSFTNDQYALGLEYGFMERFMLRGGFLFEDDVFDDNLRTTVNTGPQQASPLICHLEKVKRKFHLIIPIVPPIHLTAPMPLALK